MFFGRLTKRKLFSTTAKSPARPVRVREPQSMVLEGRRIDFTLVHSRLARNVHLKINHQNELEVVVPYRFGTSNLPSLLAGKTEWIIAKLYEAKKRSSGNKLKNGSIISVLGMPKKIVLAGIPLKTRIRETSDSLIITSNSASVRRNVENITTPDPLTAPEKKLLEIHLRKTAKKYLLERTALVSEHMGTRYYRISIRAQRSRWGSCSRENNLNFNWKLVFMPLEVIDYIIIHELAHTVHHNHGPRFHALVEAHCPNYRQLKKILRENKMPF